MAEFTKYVTPVFRMSFPEIAAAKSYQGNEPKFSCAAVWTPKTFSDAEKKRWVAILGALDAESKIRFKKPWKELPANIKKGIRDGAEKSDLGGYGEGTRFANLTTKMRPGVVDAQRRVIALDEAERTKLESEGKNVSNELLGDAIYAGCYCRATVNVYSFEKGGGKGVAMGLLNLQKVADGESLSSRTDAADDFADEEIDDQWLEQDEGNEFLDDDIDIPF